MIVKPLAARSRLNGGGTGHYARPYALLRVRSLAKPEFSHGHRDYSRIAIMRCFDEKNIFPLLLRENSRELPFLSLSLFPRIFFPPIFSPFSLATLCSQNRSAELTGTTIAHARFHISPPLRGQFRKLSVAREPPTCSSVGVNARDQKERIHEVEEKKEAGGEGRRELRGVQLREIITQERVKPTRLYLQTAISRISEKKKKRREGGGVKGEN